MEEIILLYALENAFKEGRIEAVTIRRVEDLLVTEITTGNLPQPSSTTGKIEQEKIVFISLAMALDKLGIHTPGAENAKGKVLPFYGKFPL